MQLSIENLSILPQEFDAHQVALIKDEFDQFVLNGDGDMLLDCRQMTFIDSAGIGAIVYLYKRLSRHQRGLKLLGVTGQPLKLMSMLRVNVVISFVDESDVELS